MDIRNIHDNIENITKRLAVAFKTRLFLQLYDLFNPNSIALCSDL